VDEGGQKVQTQGSGGGAEGESYGCTHPKKHTQTLACLIKFDHPIHLRKLAAWCRREAPPPASSNGPGPVDQPPVWKSDLAAHQRGIKAVGIPIGTAAFVQAVGNKVVEKEAQLLEALPKLPNLQISSLLLSFCAVPRLNHLRR